MFNYKKYRQGHYDKYNNIAKKRNGQFRNTYENSIDTIKTVVVNGQPHPNSKLMLLHRRSQFNKSRRRRIKKRKTVRFAETLEEKYIICDHDNTNSNSNSNNITDVKDDNSEKKYDWDISIDFEELI